MPPEDRPTVVVDPDDDPRFSDELDRRVDVAAGVIVVRPVPGVADKRRLATDMLIALGKHYDCLSRERQSSRAWDLMRLWISAERVRHLVVWDAHRLPGRLHRELAAIASATSSRLWIVVRPAESNSGVPAAACTPGELLAQLPVRTGAADAHLDDGLVLPQESFLTFRWACMQRLCREQFALVDAAYVAAYEETRRWLEGRHWQDRPRLAEVVRQLRALTAGSLSSTETLVRLRGAQAAYFRDGALAQIDPAGLWARPDVPAVGLTLPLAARLRRLVTPMWACALALAAAGLSVTELTRLKVGDLSTDGTVLTLGGERLDVRCHAGGLVRAQLLARAEQDASAADPLFARASQPFDTAPLARRLDDAARLACLWRPSDERRPLWHPAPVPGHAVRLVPLGPNWEAAASA